MCGEREVSRKDFYVCQDCRRCPGNLREIRAPYCDRCGLPYEGEVTDPFVCGNCRDLTLHFSQARAAVIATPFMLDIIHRYKYRQAEWFGPFLGELLNAAAAEAVAGGNWDAIVPVPLHAARRREREFNQAERLGRSLGLNGASRAGRLRDPASVDPDANLARSPRTVQECGQRVYRDRGGGGAWEEGGGGG